MKRFKVRRVPSRQGSEARSLVPYVEIVAPGPQDSVGDVSMSPNLMTAIEIDHAIDSLVAELERLRKAAKAELA